jgi:hypothetical protein
MSEQPWDGQPQNSERDGKHWVLDRYGEEQIIEWKAGIQRWFYGGWLETSLFARHFLYLGPCLNPAEVEALIADQTKQLAAQIETMRWIGLDGENRGRREALAEVGTRERAAELRGAESIVLWFNRAGHADASIQRGRATAQLRAELARRRAEAGNG